MYPFTYDTFVWFLLADVAVIYIVAAVFIFLTNKYFIGTYINSAN